MSEADVVYSDVKFTRAKENANSTDGITTSRTQPELAASPHQTGSKVTPERVAVVVLSLLLAAALIGLGFTFYKNNQTVENLNKLSNELQALKRNLTDESCLKCEPGWDQHGGKCYYFSNATSIWRRSRNQCRYEGADLVKIDSREEQEYLEQRVREKMKDDGDRFWIGLTDSEKEGRWLWTDGSPLNNSLSFWRPKQPNNFIDKGHADGEDCAMMGEKESAQVLKCWHDEFCNRPHRYICEKAEGTGRPQCIFGSS